MSGVEGENGSKKWRLPCSAPEGPDASTTGWHEGATVFSEVSLEQLRAAHQQFSQARGWTPYHRPRNLVLALVGEVGELAECFQWHGEVDFGLPTFTDDQRERLRDELADVLLYTIRLADTCGIHLAAACRDKAAKNALKYPVEP